MSFVLLAIGLVLFLICFKKTNWNLAIPSNLVFLSLLLGYFFYCIGFYLWENTLKFTTFWVIFTIFLFCFILSMISKTRKNYTILKIDSTLNVSNFRVITLISFFLFAVYFLSVVSVAIKGGSGIEGIFSYLKDNPDSVNIVIKQFYKIVVMFGFVNCYILVLGFLCKNSNKFDLFLCILNILLSCLINIISGARGDILKILGAFVVFLFIFKIINRQTLKKIALLLTVVILVFLIIFYFAKELIKTSDVLTNDLNFFDYIVYYIGSPFEVLNIKINSPIYFSYNPLFTMFNDIYNDLLDLKMISPVKFETNGFVYLGNLNFGGNVATLLFDFISSFGIIFGVAILIFFIFISNLFYFYVSNKKSSFLYILYGYIAQIFIFSFYTSVIYQVISVTGFLNILVLIALYFCLFRTNRRLVVNLNNKNSYFNEKLIKRYRSH